MAASPAIRQAAAASILKGLLATAADLGAGAGAAAAPLPTAGADAFAAASVRFDASLTSSSVTAVALVAPSQVLAGHLSSAAMFIWIQGQEQQQPHHKNVASKR